MFQNRGVTVLSSLCLHDQRVIVDKIISRWKRAVLIPYGFNYVTIYPTANNRDVFYSVRVEIIKRNRKGKPTIIEAL